ncbi:hypothetical protein C0Z18_18540 [Trinickia dabaoshanensis]|uniref:Uncharacterized protein n=1 Tax=Trinickia dabaoshanensis TaxID=564714 RepID=A0A2N7VL42_9BURK|nr:toprim domain-containing protein [Trinickia dabaoshanensis]PMS17846.1 hypothetical protein C0Z18_18540 [Trinickia dabaoshanensis]
MGVTLDVDGGAVWHCFRCGVAGARADRQISHYIGNSFVRRPEHKQFDTLAPRWASYWNRLGVLRDDGLAYLNARGCAIPPLDGDLRFDPMARHPSGYVGPAIVGLVTDATDARIARTLHRTWIQANGIKAHLQTPRMLLRRHRKAGGVIRLWPDEAVTVAVGVAEGVESALSAARVFKPMWCCLDAGNLGQLPMLPGVEAITIFADHDPPGLRAAEACASRWSDVGRLVRIVCPPEAGQDMNDILREERHA